MVAKRRRLLYAIVVVVIVILYLQYGRWTDPSTKSLPVTKPRVESESEKVSGIAEKEAVENVDYGKDGEKFPLSSFKSLPSGKPAAIPRIQFPFPQEDAEAARLRKDRQAAIKEAFIHSWTGYKKWAWMKDEVAPLTRGHRTTLSGWAATLVDSLDTLWIMGLEQDFHEALNGAATINFRTPATLPINVFETTIRYLGGFLGAYDVSEGKYPMLLEKAHEVGEMLYEAFDTPNRLPITRWSKLKAEVAAGDTLVAEIGSLSLEFTRLSQLTGDPKYFDAVQRITDFLADQQMQTKLPGLFPVSINAREADFFTGNGIFTIGGMADSLYEYFPKQYVMLVGVSEQCQILYENAIAAMKEYIFFRPMTSLSERILLAGTVRVFKPPKLELDPQMQHLSCFAGGMVALAAKVFNRPGDMELAVQLTNGCLWAGRSTASGIMPELFHTTPCPGLMETCAWNEEKWADDMFRRNTNDDRAEDKQLPKQQRLRLKQERLRLPVGMSAIAARQYMLRPEVVESLFVMYRVTGDDQWREEAWSLFTAITNQARTETAFAQLEDVTSSSSRQIDRMESFWLAETLKYFYLIFSEPDEISLDEYVFNTEAHALKWPH